MAKQAPVKPDKPTAENDALSILRGHDYLHAEIVRVQAEQDDTVVLFVDRKRKKPQVRTAYFARNDNGKVDVTVKQGWGL